MKIIRKKQNENYRHINGFWGETPLFLIKSAYSKICYEGAYVLGGIFFFNPEVCMINLWKRIENKQQDLGNWNFFIGKFFRVWLSDKQKCSEEYFVDFIELVLVFKMLLLK